MSQPTGGAIVHSGGTLCLVAHCLQAEHHGSGGMPTHLIPVAGLMLIVVAGIYMLAGGSSANKGDGGDIESPRKFPRRTAQD
jgi:hypothetical protein